MKSGPVHPTQHSQCYGTAYSRQSSPLTGRVSVVVVSRTAYVPQAPEERRPARVAETDAAVERGGQIR
eukprot:2908600-Pyramimonas_sp.AAC.1